MLELIPFPESVYVATFVGACLVTLLSLPLWRQWCHATNHVDDPGHRKIHHTPMALAGGLAVLTGIVVPLALGASSLFLGYWDPDTTHRLVYGFQQRMLPLTMLLLGAFGMLFLGWLDDRHALKPTIKFTGQFLIATLVSLAGVRITLFIESTLFSYAITILWILTITNAINFMDNMNGLCTGIGFIGSVMFGLTAAFQGDYLVTSMAFLLGGALLGFFPYNFPRASAFLGDAGSHLVGYWLAILAILTTYYSGATQSPWAVLRPLLILGLPLLDFGWVILWRLWHRQPVYIGDTNHLSHQLVKLGFHPNRAVPILWLAAALFAATSFLIR